VTSALGRLAGNITVAARSIQAGASLGGVLLYPIRRRSASPRHQIDVRGGIVLVSPPDEPILPMFQRIWGRRVYVPQGYEIQPGDTVIDVGANVGVFSVWAASRAPGVRVISLEPSPRICRYLRENVRRNALEGITVFEAACGGKTGRATLYSQGYETNNSLYGRDLWGEQYEARYEVDVMTLEQVLDQGGIGRCDLLKMNCEGGEYDTLFNCPAPALARIRRIAMEYHIGRQDRSPDMVAELLRATGFEVRMLPLHDAEGGYMYATRAAD
jgi:FkbM family methyltransferase